MDKTPQILFALADVVDGKEISPSAIPIGMLTEFGQDVLKFVAGSAKEVTKSDLIVSIEPGSLGLGVAKTILGVSLLADVGHVHNARDVVGVDSARAEVLLKWQRQATGSERRITIMETESGSKNVLLRIAKDTYITARDDPAWVATELYLQGLVVDSGGSKSVNVHIRVGDETITVAAKPDQIRNEEKHHVDHEVLLRVAAEQNLDTGAIRNVTLIEFVDYRPQFDAAAFAELTKKGSDAWKDVEDVSTWLQSVRGS